MIGWQIRLVLCSILLISSARGADVQQPNAADLVREVRAAEAWIDHLDSFQLTADISWHQTAEDIAIHKADLARRFPQTQPTEQNFPELRANSSQHLELAFDKTRMFKRVTSSTTTRLLDVRMWDGKRAYLHEKYANQENYALDKTPYQYIGQFFLLDMMWPRAGQHDYWWELARERAGDDFNGPADEFRITGHEVFRGVDCWKLECDWYQHTWFVGVADHRLYGNNDDAYHTEQQPLVDKMCIQIAKDAGKDLQNADGYGAWYESLSAAKKHEIDEVFWKRIRSISVHYHDLWRSDYREVSPGDWMPMQQGYNGYTEDGKRKTTEATIQITSVKISQPLPDALFHMQIPEGALVNDWGHVPPLMNYRYKMHFTADEWNAILAKGAADAKRLDQYEHAGDDLIGKPAIPFPPDGKWLNTSPLTLKDLKGKIVILDFFSESCGPCRNDLPTLADLHKNAKTNGLTIIGIHTAGSAQEKIDALLKQFDLEYPIYVDAFDANQSGWGKLVDAYNVQGIPQAFVIDGNGKLAAHGSLGKVLGVAQDLVGASQGH